MDQDEEYADIREELLQRFRESLGKPMTERYFDEADLVEIFDYAGDLNDDYLRMEALLCGARYFPDSEALLERRGIFYAQYSEETCQEFLGDNPADGNLILEILNLRSFPPEGEDAKSRLDAIVKNNERLGDEEMIQLIGVASALNQYEWLKANVDELRKKNDFVNIVLYETANAAENFQDFKYGVQLLEELTEIEPFNSYYWMLLARQYAEMDQGDKALSAIDYSLAIKPDAPLSLLVKAKLLYALERPVEDVIALTRQAIALSDGDIDCVRFLAQVYNANNRSDDAKRLLEDTLRGTGISDNNGRDRAIDIIPDLVIYNPDNIDQLFDRFFAAYDDNTQIMWASWAQQLSMMGYPHIAKKCLECYERNTGIKIPSLFSIEDSFVSQNFEEAVTDMIEYIKNIGASESDFPTLVAMHIVSMVKSGAMKQAYVLCDFFERNFDIDKYKSLGNRLEYIGLKHIISEIKEKMLLCPNPDEWKDYDPFGYWHKQ